MKYDINRPWLSLDDWQKEYVYSKDPNQDNFLLCGRQVGKTAAMSLRAVELCVKHFKKGEFVLINSITEKQAYHMMTKSLIYAKSEYYDKVVWKGKDKPTMHKLMFENGTGILCYAAGESGDGQRGLTIKKLMIDEGSRMSEEYFISAMPMLSVTDGSVDIASTPAGKKHKDGSLKFFYKCSLNPKFKKYYVSAEDCPRHSEDFLLEMKERLSRLAYAQEFQAVFTDELKRIFPDELINEICILKRSLQIDIYGKYFLGVDVAGFGRDETTYEILKLEEGKKLKQIENIIEKNNYTTETATRIIKLENFYRFKKIGIDDGGIGFGVFSELMRKKETKRKTIALNNSSRQTDKEGKKSKKILKEEMYINLLVLMENKKILLLDDEEVKDSLSTIQYDEEGKIFGSYSHVTEGIIRAAWLAEKSKGLNIWVY